MREEHTQVIREFKEHPEGAWTIGLTDCANIYNLVRQERPKKILDLGSGIGLTSAVAAMALKDTNTNGQVFSVEQFEKCLKIQDELTPQDIKKYIKQLHYEIEIFQEDYQFYLRYKNLVQGDWDIIIIDGPGPIRDGDKVIELPGGDFFELVKNAEEGTVFYIDQRFEMVKLIRRYTGQYLKLIAQGQGFHILERNQEPYKGIKDYTFERLKNKGYFNE